MSVLKGRKSTCHRDRCFSWERLIITFPALVELGPIGLEEGLETVGGDVFLVEGAALEAHVHQVFIGGEVGADAGVGGGVEGLDVLLEGGAELVDVVDHPVVFDAFPDVLGLGFGFEAVGELGEVHVVDGGGPGVYGRLAKGFKSFLAEFGVEGFVEEGAGEVDTGVVGVVGFAGVDGDLEVVVAEVLAHAVCAGDGAQGEADVVYFVIVEGGEDRS